MLFRSGRTFSEFRVVVVTAAQAWLCGTCHHGHGSERDPIHIGSFRFVGVENIKSMNSMPFQTSQVPTPASAMGHTWEESRFPYVFFRYFRRTMKYFLIFSDLDPPT